MVTMLGIWELDRQQKRVLLIDEPDAHIHPDLQIKFADFLCHIARQFKVQLFVATHSTTLLAALGQFGGDDVGIVFVRADVAEMRAEPFDAVGRELAALLGGHLLMGPLFGAPILLVEGDDDYRVWVQASRSGSIGLCVLPGNGDEIKKYRASLEKVFAALSDNAQLRGYAIVDGDKYEHEVPAAQYVPFIRLNCHEIENLYLSNEVLAAMGHTWETAVAAISQEAHRFGERQEELLELSAIDRQSADLKELIPHIAEILDKKGLLWTVRLGKVIGASRPSGMLSEFLGPEVMAALWPAVPEAASAPS